MSKEKKTFMSKVKTALICVFIVLVYFLPLYVLVNVSLRDITDLSSRLLPTTVPTAQNYVKIISDSVFWSSLLNTFLFATFEAIFLIPAASMGGYALARSSGRIVRWIRSMNVLLLMIPATALLVGTYSFMVKLNLTNSIIGIALLEAGGSMTSAMFFYTTFTIMIPKELDEAAAIDGAGVMRTYFQIILPQLKAITITRLIDVLNRCWNSYLMPLYLLNKSNKYTILLFVRKLFTGNTTVPDVPLAFAGCTLMIAPILVVFVCLQKHIIGGEIDSAIKG